MNNPGEESQLAALVLAGSREAYSQLYEITITEVYRTVRFLVGGSSDTDDVVQEIYIQMYRSLGQYDAARPFRPWLMGVVMRQIRAYRRKRWNHTEGQNIESPIIETGGKKNEKMDCGRYSGRRAARSYRSLCRVSLSGGLRIRLAGAA